MGAGSELEVLRCRSCHRTFTPPRPCCPGCGNRTLEPGRLPNEGIVIAATELAVAPLGWKTPHPLLLIELAEGLRVLAVGPRPIPEIGGSVRVAKDAEGYRIG